MFRFGNSIGSAKLCVGMFKGCYVKMYSLVLASSAVIFHFDFYVGLVYYQCMDTPLLCSLVLECSDVC